MTYAGAPLWDARTVWPAGRDRRTLERSHPVTLVRLSRTIPAGAAETKEETARVKARMALVNIVGG